MAYSQNDPAWKNTRLGNSVSAGDTIGAYGCNITAIANVCAWAGNNLTPAQVNDICKQRGWFSASSPGDNDLINRDDIPALLCSNLGYMGRTNWSGPTDINFFNDASDPNVAYIILIDASPRPGVQTHYTMVWAKPDASDLQIDDSWDGKRKALSSYGNPSAIIQSAMKFVKVAPAPPPPPAYTVSVDPIDKRIDVIPGRNKWNLDLPNFDAIAANPVGGCPKDPITVKGLLHRSDLPNYAYYLEDPNVYQGYNMLDCTDHIASPVYVPPAAPMELPKAKMYHTNFPVPIYANEVAARSRDRSKSLSLLAIDNYYIHAEAGKALNLSSDNAHDQQLWINVLDDVVPNPVVPEPVREPVPDIAAALEPSVPIIDSASKIIASYKWFFSNHKPVTYRVRRPLVVQEYVHGRTPVQVRAGSKIDIYGAFEVNGKKYLRPLLPSDVETHRYYYGIEYEGSIYEGAPNLEGVGNLVEKLQTSWEWILEHALHPKQTLEGIFRIKIK
jgi:hypothetical protein